MYEVPVPSLTVQQLKQTLDQGGQPILLDVREDHEVAICTLPGAIHIPLNQLPLRASELPTDQPIVVYCHHGGRSAQAALYLMNKGHADIHNLAGGIHGWATSVDPDMPTY